MATDVLELYVKSSGNESAQVMREPSSVLPELVGNFEIVATHVNSESIESTGFDQVNIKQLTRKLLFGSPAQAGRDGQLWRNLLQS